MKKNMLKNLAINCKNLGTQRRFVRQMTKHTKKHPNLKLLERVFVEGVIWVGR